MQFAPATDPKTPQPPFPLPSRRGKGVAWPRWRTPDARLAPRRFAPPQAVAARKYLEEVPGLLPSSYRQSAKVLV